MPAEISMAPPCWQGRHARGSRSASGNGRMATALQQKDVHTARLRCASLSTKLPYHTHQHEPIKLLDQAQRLVVAAVARHVTAEITDVAQRRGERLRQLEVPRQRGSSPMAFGKPRQNPHPATHARRGYGNRARAGFLRILCSPRQFGFRLRSLWSCEAAWLLVGYPRVLHQTDQDIAWDPVDR